MSRRKKLVKSVLPPMLLLLVAAGCQPAPPKSGSWQRSIKDASASCSWTGYRPDGATEAINIRCTITDTRSYKDGEIPYFRVEAERCGEKRVNGRDGGSGSWRDTRLDCIGSMSQLRLSVCQTRNGPRPDDCTSRNSFSL